MIIEPTLAETQAMLTSHTDGSDSEGVSWLLLGISLQVTQYLISFKSYLYWFINLFAILGMN